MNFHIGQKIRSKSWEEIQEIGDETNCGFVDEHESLSNKFGIIIKMEKFQPEDATPNLLISFGDVREAVWWCTSCVKNTLLEKLDKVLE